jgi:anti-sigma regulatory factor (Ser/Thr protein kinase)
MAEIELEIPARPEFLSLARQVVAAAAAVEPRFRAERIDDLRLAVSEAITNAVEAHADVLGVGRIWIRCDLDAHGDSIRVEVHDAAGGFDLDAVPSVPEPDDPSRLGYEHGLGIPIMRELADETEIRTTDSGTMVELVVYRSSTAAARPVDADDAQSARP